MKTTKEFVIKQKEEEKKMNEKQNRCFICKKHIEPGKKKKPRWQWNMEYDVFLCEKCFKQKESDYEKKINFCVNCGKKIGFVRYNPKPKWKIDGQLCRQCWDSINNTQN